MKAFLSKSTISRQTSSLEITGSKSESNRLLILQAQFSKITIENLSNSDDTRVLQKALETTGGTLDIHHAGTAMRFLTAFFASTPNTDVVLTGSARMQERPIGILVNALRSLGAQIVYTQKEGYPPLRIKGQKIIQSEVTLSAQTSSQFVSALMLIAPSLKNGLRIHLEGMVTSRPYIEMTLSLLNEVGVSAAFSANEIVISPVSSIPPVTVTVESDWSSASYFYSLVALSDTLTLSVRYFKKNSRQGDAQLAEIYEALGVQTEFKESQQSIILSKTLTSLPKKVSFDLIKTPDIAQTIAVTCFGLGVGCTLTGLHTLKIKETDRLVALQQELEKLGATISVDDNSLTLEPATLIRSGQTIATYNDHRMAMAFAPLALKTDLAIADAEVVSKSFPDFWEAISTIGISVKLQ